MTFTTRVTGTYNICYKAADDKIYQTNVYLEQDDTLPIFRIIGITLVSPEDPKKCDLWEDETYRAFFMDREDLIKKLIELPHTLSCQTLS